MKIVKSQNQENPLIALLWQKMLSDEETPRELSAHLDISYVYLMALARGERPIDKADRKVFVSASRYLDIPTAQAYLLAGALQPSDFMVENSFTSKIEHVFERMKSDPEWCGFVPDDKTMKRIPNNVKILVGLLYERVAKTSDLSSVCVPMETAS